MWTKEETNIHTYCRLYRDLTGTMSLCVSFQSLVLRVQGTQSSPTLTELYLECCLGDRHLRWQQSTPHCDGPRWWHWERNEERRPQCRQEWGRKGWWMRKDQDNLVTEKLQLLRVQLISLSVASSQRLSVTCSHCSLCVLHPAAIMGHRCRTWHHKKKLLDMTHAFVLSTLFSGSVENWNTMKFLLSFKRETQMLTNTHTHTYYTQSKVNAGYLTEGCSPTVCVRKGGRIGCHGNLRANLTPPSVSWTSVEKDVWPYSPKAWPLMAKARHSILLCPLNVENQLDILSSHSAQYKRVSQFHYESMPKGLPLKYNTMEYVLVQSWQLY